MNASVAPAFARPTNARLIKPAPALSGCTWGYVFRSTVGLDLSPAERMSYFPVTPSCALIWVLEGALDWGRCANEPDFLPSPQGVLFRGPHARPFVTRSPGPVRLLICQLLPDALHDLVGFDPVAWVDRVVPVAAVLGPDWQAMADTVQAAHDDAERVACIESFLAPRWQALGRPRPGQTELHRYQEWVEAVAARATSTARGRSTRQVERRVKALTGLSLRTLRNIGRIEHSFFHLRAPQPDTGPTWLDVAADGGWADQAHLCRTVRRACGFSPVEIRRNMAHDEAFWVYRIWR